VRYSTQLHALFFPLGSIRYSITMLSSRVDRDVLSTLLEKGYLISDHKLAPVRLEFPPQAVEQWLPGLYSTIS
jgi:hypothetical protein